MDEAALAGKRPEARIPQTDIVELLRQRLGRLEVAHEQQGPRPLFEKPPIRSPGSCLHDLQTTGPGGPGFPVVAAPLEEATQRQMSSGEPADEDAVI